MSEESSTKPGALVPRPDPGPGPGNSSLPSFYSSNQTHFACGCQTGRRAERCGREIMPGKRTTRERLTSCFTHCKQFSAGRLKHITGGWGALQPSTGTPTAHSPLPDWDQHRLQSLKPSVPHKTSFGSSPLQCETSRFKYEITRLELSSVWLSHSWVLFWLMAPTAKPHPEEEPRASSPGAEQF